MKKLLLTFLLTIISSSAMAEWVEFIKDDEEILTVYVDPTTMHKNGNNVKIWILAD